MYSNIAQNIKNQYQRTQALVKEGNLSNANLLDLDAQLATAEFDVANASGNIMNTKLALAQLMGFGASNQLVLETVQTTNNHETLDEAYLKRLTEVSINNHPALKTATWRLKSGQLGIKIAEAGRLPNVSFGGGAGTVYSNGNRQFDYFNQLNFNLNQYARLSVNIPIFLNGQLKNKIETSRLAVLTNEVELAKTKFQLQKEMEQAFRQAAIAQQKLKAAKRQLDAQQLAFESASGRYFEGLLHTVELGTFRLNLEKATISHIQAQYEFVFRKMVLEMY